MTGRNSKQYSHMKIYSLLCGNRKLTSNTYTSCFLFSFACFFSRSYCWLFNISYWLNINQRNHFRRQLHNLADNKIVFISLTCWSSEWVRIPSPEVDWWLAQRGNSRPFSIRTKPTWQREQTNYWNLLHLWYRLWTRRKRWWVNLKITKLSSWILWTVQNKGSHK